MALRQIATEVQEAAEDFSNFQTAAPVATAAPVSAPAPAAPVAAAPVAPATPAANDAAPTAVPEPTHTRNYVEQIKLPPAPEILIQTKDNKLSVYTQSTPIVAFNNYKDVLGTDTLIGLGYGAFDRVTVDVGGFVREKEPIGNRIKIQMFSWNDRWLVATGGNDEAAKKKVRISYDGRTVIQTNEDVNAVLDQFRAEGYAKASIKQYVDIWGQLVYSNDKDVPEVEQKFVQLQLSPESVKKWRAFVVQTSFGIASGKVDETSIITVDANRGEFGGNRFGYCTFSFM